MKLELAYVSALREKQGDLFDQMTKEYITRAQRYAGICAARFDSEEGLLRAAAKSGRSRTELALFDMRGEMTSSEGFAREMERLRDGGVQTWMLAIGPADGWGSEARAAATKVFSFGPITLPHQLARVVLAEQVYRALTILAGHPYHCGH